LAHGVADEQRAGWERAQATQLLQELQKVSRKRYVTPYSMAVVFAGLGDKEQTLSWLEKASWARDEMLPFLRVDLRLALLWADRRFQKLVRRMKFPE
jgi:hypothetical protein